MFFIRIYNGKPFEFYRPDRRPSSITFVFERKIILPVDVVSNDALFVSEKTWERIIEERGPHAIFTKRSPVSTFDVLKIIINLRGVNTGLEPGHTDYVDLARIYKDIHEQYHEYIVLLI